MTDIDLKDNEQQFILQHDFQSLSLDELKNEEEKIRTASQRIQNELSDLAFHNYPTYLDVGRTAEYCKEKFLDINTCMQQLRSDFPKLLENISDFRNQSQQILCEFKILNEIDSTNCIIWEVLKLPNLMEKCISTGNYEQAYALTNFAISMEQSQLIQNPMFKNVIDFLLESRHRLLDELFNKFAGPIDLAKSIQIVNNIQKIPYISNTQLRVSILQYRDIYLEKKVRAITSDSDFIFRVIELYRECMYDTIVLYSAVFPDADIQRKFISMNDDPRWERWTSSSQNFLLQSWAQRNIERLLTVIRGVANKTMLDLEAMISKLMNFAFSFGRMGLDFRLLIQHEFSHIIIEIFEMKIELATKSFIARDKIELIDGDIFEHTRQELLDTANYMEMSLSAPFELCIWDDLSVYGNSIIDTLNEIRHMCCINLIRRIFIIILCSFQNVFGWLDTFLIRPEKISSVKKAVNLLLQHFIPFINKCFFHCFPYDLCGRQYLRAGYCAVDEYISAFTFTNKNLFALCHHETLLFEIFEEVKKSQQPVQKEKFDVVIEQDLAAQPKENDKFNNKELKESTITLDN